MFDDFYGGNELFTYTKRLMTIILFKIPHLFSSNEMSLFNIGKIAFMIFIRFLLTDYKNGDKHN